MTALVLQFHADENLEPLDLTGTERRGVSYDGDATIRISNDASESGSDQDPGPLTWLNSARVTADRDDDAVHCCVSVGDPRGAMCFTVRRLPDGRIVIHVPQPGESMPHVHLRELHAGTYEVVDRPAKDSSAKPVDFGDPKVLEFTEGRDEDGDPVFEASHDDIDYWVAYDEDERKWLCGAKDDDGDYWRGPDYATKEQAIASCEEVAREWYPSNVEGWGMLEDEG